MCKMKRKINVEWIRYPGHKYLHFVMRKLLADGAKFNDAALGQGLKIFVNIETKITRRL